MAWTVADRTATVRERLFASPMDRLLNGRGLEIPFFDSLVEMLDRLLPACLTRLVVKRATANADLPANPCLASRSGNR